MTASLIGILFLPLLDHLAWLDRGIVGVAMLMVYLVARFWGALLPYLAEFSIAADSRAGMQTAFLYLANILGVGGGLDPHRLRADGPSRSGRDRRRRWWWPGVVCTILLIAALEIPHREKLQRAALAVAVGLVAAVRDSALVGRRAREPAMEGGAATPSPSSTWSRIAAASSRSTDGRHRVRQRHV